MGAVIGAVFGAGLLLVLSWMSGHRASPARDRKGSARLGRLINRAQVPRLSPARLIGASAATAVVVATMALIVTAVPVIALLAAVSSAGLPFLVLRRRVAKLARARQQAWPDAVDQLASAVRAGLALPEALSDISRRGPVPLRQPFRYFAEEYRASGSFSGSLERLQQAAGDPVADRVCASLRIARDVGGSDLGQVLRTLSALLREDLRTRGEILARQSWTVNAARLSAAAPWITVAVLCTRPEAVAAFTSVTGTVVLLSAAVLTWVAYRWMRLVGRLPAAERVIA